MSPKVVMQREISNIINNRQVTYGGPRPMNTLTRRNDLPDIRSTRNFASQNASSKRKKLELKAVRGDNVHDECMITGPTHGFPSQPSAKRRKVEIAISPSSSGISVEDGFKTISGDHFKATANQSISRTLSSQEQKSGVTPGKEPSRGLVHEYRKIEHLMNSDSTRSNKKRGRRNGSHSDKYSISKSSSPLIDALQQTNINETDKHTQKVEPLIEWIASDNRTAAKITQRRHLNDARMIQVTNSYTEPPPNSSSESLGFSQARLRNQGLEMETSPEILSLNKQFVQADGEKRGGLHPGSSPDELTSGTTVGNQVDTTNLAHSKRVRIVSFSKSPSPSLNPPGQVEHNAGLEPSNIRASKFGPSRPQKNTRCFAAAPPQSYAMTALNLPASGSYYQDPDLCLVHDKRNDVYTVSHRGAPAEFDGTTFQIVPRKLQKIFWELGGRKLRFESSRSGNDDNVVEIELSSEKDTSNLVKCLQHDKGPLKSRGISSEKINSMFEKRRNEQSTYNVTSRKRDSETLDVVTVPNTITNIGSTRTTTKLVSGLLGRANIEESKPKPNPSAKLIGVPKRDTVHRSRVSDILDSLKPEHNNHLRRSTRIPGVSGWPLAEDREKSEEPGVLKYSKVCGLGSKWNKPLTYPKIGKKKTTVDWCDLERLDEGEFLNDTLITFYMRYLEYQIEQQNPDLAKRIYFFSTFFYERLISTRRETKAINYQAVQKWTRHVDIFTYDYVVVPINEQIHWYLAIICNLPALEHSMAAPNDGSTKGPRKRLMDSSPPPSPRSKTSAIKDPELLYAREEAYVEKAATESFAELSLDNDRRQSDNIYIPNGEAVGARQPSTVIPESDTGEVEMLHVLGQTISDLPQPMHSAENISREESGNVFVEDADHKSKAPAASRKQKRKSLPPITHIDPKQPLIVTFDSLGSAHGIVTKVLKEYLLEEGKAKRDAKEYDVSSIRGITAKCIPQQDNFSDCGLYMLGYLEKFLSDSPPEFIAKIIRRQYKEEDWSNLQPSNMRTSLREQLQGLYEHQDEEYKTTKAPVRDPRDSNTSSPVTFSTPPAVETPKKLVPDNLIPLRNTPRPKPTNLEKTSGSPHGVGDAATTGAIDRKREEPTQQNQYSPQQTKGRRSLTPVAHLTNGEACLSMLDKKCQRHCHVDVPSSQLSAQAQQQGAADDPLELPLEIEDSQPVQLVAVATPPRAKSPCTPPSEVIRQEAVSSDVWSPTHGEGPAFPLSERRKLHRPKTQKVTNMNQGNGMRKIQTVVLD
ncbi:MAG: hypothetical protein Q9163_005103 [Psora crenata]